MNRFWLSLLLLLLPLLSPPSRSFAAEDVKMKALAAALAANPNDPNTHFNLGVEFYNRGQYEQALPELEKAAKMNSSDKQARELADFTKGYLAYTKGDFNVALKGFQAALKNNPKNQNAAKLVGKVYEQLKDYPQAEKAIQAYMAAFPSKDAQVDGNLDLGKLCVDQKRNAEAVTVLGKVLALEPRNFDALKNLGVAHFQAGDFTQAAAAWKKASESMTGAQSPQEKAVVYKYMGFSYYRSGNLQDAIRCYQKSLKLDNTDYDTLYNLGVAHLDNGAYDDAAEVFRQAFAKNPSDSNAALGQAQAIDAAINAHLEKGSNLMVNSEYSEAISEWEKVLQLQPGHPEAQNFIADAKKKLAQEVGKLYEAGKAAAKAGQTLEAMKQWNAALAMDTENAKVKDAIKQLNLQTNMKMSSFAALGDDAMASGDYTKAIQAYKQAQSASPSSAGVKAKLKKAMDDQKAEYTRSFDAGAKAETAGRLRDAIQSFTKAVAVDPSSAEAKQRLDTVRVKRSVRIKDLLAEGQALFDGGKHKEAQEKFNEVLALDPTQESANDFIKKITGQQSKAKVDAEAVKKIYYEGVNLYINGKIQEAITKWQECLRMDPGNVNAQGNINKAKAKLQSIQKLRQG